MQSDDEYYVGAGLNHDSDPIRKKPANFRKVKRFHVFGPAQSKENAGKVTVTDPEKLKTDAALLELEQPWSFGGQTNIYPACLMDFESKPFEDEFLAAGYGLTEPFSEPIQSRTSAKFSWPNPFLKDGQFPKLLMTQFRLIKLHEGLIEVYSNYSSICTGI